MYDPAHPFGRKRYSRAVIDPVSCTGCGYCTMFCVMDCIVLPVYRGPGAVHRLPVLQGQLSV